MLLTLTDRDDQARLGEMTILTMDSRGLVYTTDLAVAPGLIQVFDQRGDLVRRIGREGAGPGEYRRVLPPFFGPGDTAFVVDYGLGRLTRLAPSGQYLGSSQLPGAPRQLIVLPRGLIASGGMRTPVSAGLPLHRLSRMGDVELSFGTDTALLDPRRPLASRRVIGPADSNHVWSAFVDRYVVERWSVDGDRTHIIERDADWFETSEGYEGPATVVRPPAAVQAVWEDPEGLLWVAVKVADRDWRRTNHRAKPGDMILMPRSDDHDIYDTIVEVIDVRRGVLVTSLRLRERLNWIVGGQPPVSYHEDEIGRPTYRLWRFRLTNTGGGS
jgi:hypothetical protein